MPLAKITNFDDWTDLFKVWQNDIGLDAKELTDYRFDVKLADPDISEIEFGHYRGQSKWKTVMHIPDQRIRDALQTLIVYQGDTEFASVEQQRSLLENAPSDYDLLSIYRVMAEEMRHGWQMSYLLVSHFGDEGKREAEKLLQRRADEQERLLGSFNERVENWLDFFTYTEFIDRDGKFQLQMMSTSAFAPLSRSMKPMLREESFHLGTGNNGLHRIIKARRIPTSISSATSTSGCPPRSTSSARTTRRRRSGRTPGGSRAASMSAPIRRLRTARDSTNTRASCTGRKSRGSLTG